MSSSSVELTPIIITNKDIIEYYEKNSLDFEEMNLLFIDIMERLFFSAAPKRTQMADLINQIKQLTTQVSVLQDTTAQTFATRFIEFKRDYMEDMKLLFSSYTADKIAPLLDKNTEHLNDKIKLLLGELLPRGNGGAEMQAAISRDIQNIVRDFQTNLAQNTVSKDNLDGFMKSIEDKMTNTLFQSQTLLNTIITSTEQRLQTQMTDIRENCNTTQIQSNLSDLIRKMEGSTKKGEYSENLLYNVILSIFPSARVENVGRTKETGDIVLIRKNRAKILIENKNYGRNVNQEEVDKFYRDIEEQNLNGIFLSQKTGIVNKGNYEIEIHNNNVLVYVHNVNYDADKIKTAVSIIDHVRAKLDDIEVSEELGIPEELRNKYTIDKHMLDQINIEYKEMLDRNVLHIKNIKECARKLVAEAELMSIPNLEVFLSQKYSQGAVSEFACPCGFIGKNARALAAHQKKHRGDEYAALTNQDFTL